MIDSAETHKTGFGAVDLCVAVFGDRTVAFHRFIYGAANEAVQRLTVVSSVSLNSILSSLRYANL